MDYKMSEIYIVYLYCDYRKEVDIQHLKAFKSREDAIEFAKKYSDKNKSEREYVSIHGTEYDAPFYGENLSDDDIDEATDDLRSQMKKELNIKSGMWYMRIAVDKIIMN